MLTLQAKLPERFRFDAFQEELSKYLQHNKEMVSRFRESHGIDFPPQEGGAADEQGQEPAAATENGVVPSVQDSVLSSGTIRTDGVTDVKAEPATTDSGPASSLSMDLSQLIQDSLKKKEASQTPSLASLIAEKIGNGALTFLGLPSGSLIC